MALLCFCNVYISTAIFFVMRSSGPPQRTHYDYNLVHIVFKHISRIVILVYCKKLGLPVFDVAFILLPISLCYNFKYLVNLHCLLVYKPFSHTGGCFWAVHGYSILQRHKILFFLGCFSVSFFSSIFSIRSYLFTDKVFGWFSHYFSHCDCVDQCFKV